MKNLLTTLLIVLTATFASAQTTDTAAMDSTTADTVSYWKTGGKFTTLFNQTSLTNWAGGGQSSLSLASNFEYFANYADGKKSWQNNISGSYGINEIKGEETRKTQDYLEINSKYGRNISPLWSLSGFATVQSQFTPGYNYENDPEGTNYISNFFAPGYVLEGIGFEYNLPDQGFSFTISPLTVKHTFVMDEGVKATDYGLDSGETVRTEVGAYLKIDYKKTIAEHINFSSNLLLYSNYIEKPENVDVNWKNEVTLKVNKWLSVNFIAHFIYDDDVKFEETEEIGGVTVINSRGPRLQIRQVTGLGISFIW